MEKNKKEIESNNSEKTSIALSFINSYVDNCNKIKESVPLSEWVKANSLCSEKFKQELQRIIDIADSNPEEGLEVDPIFNAQDYPDSGFELDFIDNTKNLLVIKGKDNPAFKITMRLVLQGQNWLVDGCGSINIPDDERQL